MYVQLANFMQANKQPAESNWAELREAQFKTLGVPNTGMAVTIDIGEWNDIHPLNKEDIGKRLALAAQRVAYNDEKIVYSGPIYQSMKIEGNKVTSRRKRAILDVNLACSGGLKITQTDQFDTPYNHGIPKAYHRDRANHWHVMAETSESARKARIAALMSVRGDNEPFDVQLRHEAGWLGATATGDFGKVEGWIRFEETDTLPADLPAQAFGTHRIILVL